MDAQKKPAPPPEAVLIKDALDRQRLSGREAARRAGISETWWRQIARGYQTVSGTHLPVKAQPDVLARMAHAIGVTAEQLREADRSDAAEELERLTPPSAPASSGVTDPRVDAIAVLLADLPPEAQEEVLRRVHGMTRDQEVPSSNPARRAG